MRKKRGMKFLALLLAAMMTLSMLSACGGNDDSGNTPDDTTPPADTTPSDTTPPADTDTPADDTATPAATGEPIKDLVVWKTVSAEIETLCIQYSESSETSAIAGNSLSPLLEFDKYGALQPAVAKEWGTDDEGLTWTFKLRDDVTWVDVDGNYLADCTAQDWITSLEWVLNYAKNKSYNTSMVTPLIEGAAEYYQYTKELAETDLNAAMSTDTTKFLEMVGIEAPDDYTLIYHCTGKIAYFDTLATGACLYPLPQGMIDAVGAEGIPGISNKDFWYSGPYRLTTWTLNNEKILTRNESYWDKDCSLFDTVTITMVEDGKMDDQLWETGEVDYTELSIDTLNSIISDPNDERNQYLVEGRKSKFIPTLFFNFYEMDEDGVTPHDNWNKAAANEAFRLSFYYGLDLTNYWYLSNPIHPTMLENLAYTAPNLMVFSNGQDYVDRVVELLDLPEKTDGTPRRYNPDLGEQYKQQAIEELTAQGVTFPVEINYYIKGGNQSALDSATILKEVVEQLGTDYVQMNIKTYISSASQEVMFPQLQSFYIVGWGADFGDASNFLDQLLIHDTTAIYSMERLNLDDVTEQSVIDLFEEYTDMVREAETITGDKDARCEAFAQAEAFLIKHAMVIPWNYDIKWEMTKINDYSKMYAAYGISDSIYKNWETSTVPYTAEQYAQFAADYNG